MDLNTIWFILIAVLFIGFFILEGFDYGVGILLPFLGKSDKERRIILNTIGPFWDANEVWLLTAGGAMFAAFPNWYATMFSGFYLALVVMLLALIVRGVAFEFRSKHDDPRWRTVWDWAIFFGSAVPALLWGVALTNLIKGVPINEEMTYVGTFWTLLGPYNLLGGVLSLAGFTLQGALFLSLRTTDALEQRAKNVASRLWLPVTFLTFLTVGLGYFITDMFARLGVNPGVVPLSAGAAILLVGYFIQRDRAGWAFGMNTLAIALTIITVFMGLFPRVMVSSLNEAWSLTIYNASSSPYTLRTMAIVAAIFVPIVLLYQAWTYRVFWGRITGHKPLEY
ncbi:MAG: cytochrome d ubiquinol oxidase subunit II [Aggregatilineales bacterium]|jgi:cytochrome d ubiquinol oxidase subunit II|nr:cytochrome d ubiquinol oxidase subunit II [Chloroflexota bacterium]HOA23660.1 cytochrome d ubiquinol oxidase subunit II [Aggregatilineales bacterium]HPV08723.1 cytochrome d ubiquinol oxidase subunit II [Aggregatilineales bacterium]HQE18549.1 cytochrome d ubiquinol oxidase subunit II [Aggregatilineales bacterium]